jgi:pimeloyl-ACP methyl ester carboxylesterase
MVNLRVYLLVILASFIVIGSVTVAVRYFRDINTARAHVDNLGSQVIETACGKIEYARMGDGYPVLVIHGAMGGFDVGFLLAKPLIDAGFQVISVSRFGYLRSPMPVDANLDRQADAYACLLDTLGIQQVAVYTVSGGANSSIRFAARYPERVSALILQSPAAPGNVKVATPPRAIFDYMLRSDFVYWAFITYVKPMAWSQVGVPKGFVVSPELEGQIKDVLSSSLPSSGRMDGMIFDLYTSASEFYDEISETSAYPLSEIHIPVLVIDALDDPLAVTENVRSLAEKFPNARLFILPDGGHLLLGHAVEVNAEITQFLHSNIAVSSDGR